MGPGQNTIFHMSQDPNSPKRSEQIRNNIDTTRQQMDQTIDALANRLKGRHLADEVIGMLRSNVTGDKMEKIKDQVTQTTHSAVNNVVDSFKANPWPALLIGAGAAWLVYNSRRSKQNFSGDLESPYENDLIDQPGYELSGGSYGAGAMADDYESADLTVDQSGRIEDGSALNSKFEDLKDSVRDKANRAKEQIQQTASELGDKVRQKTQAVRDRASEIKERGRQALTHGRDRVVQTANKFPVELGLGVLALGVVAGLAIRTPEKVNQVLGPRVDRVRDRAREAGRDLVNRGKNVVQAAAKAAQQEAEAQGLSPEALREKASAVAQRTKQAATDSAREEGVLPDDHADRG